MSSSNDGMEFSRKRKLRKPPSQSLRPRNYLLPEEVKALAEAAEISGRHGLRDCALIRMMFRHGLRVSEVVALRWSQVDFERQTLHIESSQKSGVALHPLDESELEMLTQLQAKYPASTHIFMSELGKPLTTHSVRHIVKLAGDQANLEFPVSPHILRNSTGYYLYQKGISPTVTCQYLRLDLKTFLLVVPQYQISLERIAHSFETIQWDL